MKFKIYSIPQQSDIYRFKNVFIQFDIKYSTKNQTYSNEVALNSLDEEKLLDILKTNDYKYKVTSSEDSTIGPLEAYSKGVEPNLLFTTRRGVLVEIGLYSSNTNFNATLVARLGIGQSVDFKDNKKKKQ